jgi:hypothetical protein
VGAELGEADSAVCVDGAVEAVAVFSGAALASVLVSVGALVAAGVSVFVVMVFLQMALIKKQPVIDSFAG